MVNTSFYINSGEAKRLQGRVKDALVDFDKAIELDRKCGKAWGCKGVALYQLGNEIDAKKCLLKAIELDSKEPFYWNALGCINDKNMDQIEAEKCYKKALDINPHYPDSLANLGEIRRKQGRSKEAIELYNSALKMNSKIDSAWIGKSQIQFIESNYDEALKNINKALQINPNHPVAWNIKGMIYSQKKEYELAKECFEKATECDMNYIDAHINLAEMLRKKGFLDEAIKELEKSPLKAKNCPSYWNNKGAILLNMNRPEEALCSFDKALQIDSNHADANNNKIAALINLGKFKEAEDFSKTIDVDKMGPGGLYFKSFDVYVPGDNPIYVTDKTSTLKISEFVNDIIQSNLFILRSFQMSNPVYVQQFLKDKQSLQETYFRDDFKARFELTFKDISAECKLRKGFTDLRVQNSKNQIESIVFEFKIWGRNDYKEVIDQLLQYLTSFENCGIIIMINPNKKSIRELYMNEIILKQKGFIKETLVDKPIPHTGNLIHFSSDHHDAKGNRIRIFHFILDILP